MQQLSIFRTCVLLLATLGSFTASAATIAIKAGKLFDPESGSTTLNQTILVRESVIEAVGSDLEIPSDAILIDLSNATVMPGLFDAHTHLALDMGPPAGDSARDFYAALLLSTVTETTGFRAIRAVANAREVLDAGFTTIRDIGNAANYADTDLRRAIEEGIVPGPTIINAGRIIAPLGGQFPTRTPPAFQQIFGVGNQEFIGVLRADGLDLGEPEYLYADTRDEMRKAVRENILYGAKFIKIVVDDQPYAYTAEDIRFLVDEAAAAGLKVAAHCLTDAGALSAIEGGVASIEHGHLMTDATLRAAKKNNTVLVGTDFPERIAEDMGLAAVYEIGLERAKRARKIGVTMAFGTDVMSTPQGYTRGSIAMTYPRVYAEAGYSNAEILQMMTINAARLLGVENERGTIKPGQAADIIATQEDPLEDLDALQEVSFVMKDGRVFRRD